MKTIKLKVVLLYLLGVSIASAQKITLDSLDLIIYNYNNNFQYEQSIELLSELLSDDKYDSYDRYMFYVYKSYTYKRLFSYPQALLNLDLALKEGLKSNKKLEAKQTVKAEKSFIYFDTQDFKKAKEMMDELREFGYSSLDSKRRAIIHLQEASIYIDEKDYLEAEKKINYAINVVEKDNPQDLPLFYGKKISLYNRLNKPELRDSALAMGYRIAQQHGILKYQMHLYDIAKTEFQNNNDYKKSFEAQQKYDSLAYLYDSVYKVGKLEILEKKIEQDRKLAEVARQRKLKILYMVLALVLSGLLLFLVRLIVINKRKRVETEIENQKIRSTIEERFGSLNSPLHPKVNLSSYSLTPRQAEIVDFVQKGHSNKEIASKLFISENTVKYHLKIIYDKLDIDNRKQLMERL